MDYISGGSMNPLRKTSLIIYRICIIVFVFLFCSCDILDSTDDPGIDEEQGLTADFFLYDTTGKAAIIFQPGENFIVSFSFENTFDDTIRYWKPSLSRPAVIFEILGEDGLVSTSIDGYLFPAVGGWGVMLPGRTLLVQWKAPNTPVRDPQIILTPGLYETRMLLPDFGVEVKTETSITFKVI
jgi:hypothetical protein